MCVTICQSFHLLHKADEIPYFSLGQNTAEEEGFGISAPGAGVGEIKVETWQGKVMDDPSDDDSNEDELAALPDAASTYTERKVLDQKLSHTTGYVPCPRNDPVRAFAWLPLSR